MRSLTVEELAKNAKVLSGYDKKEEILEELKVTDIANFCSKKYVDEATKKDSVQSYETFLKKCTNK